MKTALTDRKIIVVGCITILLTCFNIYFAMNVYLYEKKNLIRTLNETVSSSIETFKKYNRGDTDEKITMPDSTSENPDAFLTDSAYSKPLNFILNGNFEMGDSLFKSEYKILPNGITAFTPIDKGWRVVTKNPFFFNGHWKGLGYGQKGNYLVLDGAILPNTIAWEQTVPVRSKKLYLFKLKIASVAVYKQKTETTNWSIAKLRVLINGKVIGIIKAPFFCKKWVSYSIPWLSDSSTATIQLIDENTIGLYNDFGIDELALHEYRENLNWKNDGRNTQLQNYTVSKTDTTVFKSILAEEMLYRAVDFSYSITLMHVNKIGSYYKKSQAYIEENETYYNRFVLFPNGTLSTRFYYLDKNISVSINVPKYRIYLFKKMAVLTLGLALITVVCFILLYMIYSNAKKEKQIAVMKYDLTNNITHELKTPVATIMAAMDALKNHGLIESREKTEKYIEITTIQANKLNNLIESALKIAMTSSDSFQLTLEQIQMEELCESVLKSMTLPETITIIKRFSIEKTIINGDRSHLSNAIQTLLDNSIKYAGQNAVIELETTAAGKNISLSIKDNGPGIAKKHQKLVFEKYYRIADTDVHNVKGHGMGLSYVKTIADLHKATVELVSDGKTGTEIILTFKQ